MVLAKVPRRWMEQTCSRRRFGFLFIVNIPLILFGYFLSLSLVLSFSLFFERWSLQDSLHER